VKKPVIGWSTYSRRHSSGLPRALLGEQRLDAKTLGREYPFDLLLLIAKRSEIA
jgi:hypothetical protein